jgi:hypothetical protein
MFKIKFQLLIISALVLMLTACLKKEEEPRTPAPANSQAASTPNQSGPASASPAAVVSAPGPAIAVADGETPGRRAEVQELKRSGNNVMLRIALVNDTDDTMDFGYNFGDKANEIKDFNTIGGITLVDGAGKKKYFVIRDSENNCVCSSGLKGVPAKSRANLWAKFPAPPDDVQRISVVIPHFTPLDDVPISR